MAGRGKQIRRVTDSVALMSTEQNNVPVGSTLLAKYSYKANVARPGGFNEADIRQFEKVSLLNKGYGDNPLWWEIAKADGTKGYVPANYLTTDDSNSEVTSLPWLKQQSEDEHASAIRRNVQYKSYIPTYAENKKAQASNQYFCGTCERSFNGPVPYRAHMSSRAHKEEVQAAELYA